MVGADHLIILTNVDGVYSGDPVHETQKVIPVIEDVSQYFNLVDDSRSAGKGGMRGKLLSADLITSLGIPMYIGKRTPRQSSLHAGCRQILTHRHIFFLHSIEKEKFKKLALLQLLLERDALLSARTSRICYTRKSLLLFFFSGIEQIEGTFHEKDVVDICDTENNTLARGLVRSTPHMIYIVVSNNFLNFIQQDNTSMKSSDIIAVHYDCMVMKCKRPAHHIKSSYINMDILIPPKQCQ